MDLLRRNIEKLLTLPQTLDLVFLFKNLLLNSNENYFNVRNLSDQKNSFQVIFEILRISIECYFANQKD